MVRGIEAGADADKLDYETGLKNKPVAEPDDSDDSDDNGIGYSSETPVQRSFRQVPNSFYQLALTSPKFLTHTHFTLVGGEVGSRGSTTAVTGWFRCADYLYANYVSGTPLAVWRAARNNAYLEGDGFQMIIVQANANADGRLYIQNSGSGNSLHIHAIEFFNFA